MIKDAKEYCNKIGITVPHFCVQYIKFRCSNGFLIFGAEEPKQIIDNLSYFNNNVSEKYFIAWEDKYNYNDENQISIPKWK